MPSRNKALPLLKDKIDTIRCTFDSKYIKGLSKLYTYKCKKSYCEPGELVVVVANGEFKFALVVEVDKEPTYDLSVSYYYQWIYSKLDSSVCNKCMAAERELVAWLDKQQKDTGVTHL